MHTHTRMPLHSIPSADPWAHATTSTQRDLHRTWLHATTNHALALNSPTASLVSLLPPHPCPLLLLTLMSTDPSTTSCSYLARSRRTVRT